MLRVLIITLTLILASCSVNHRFVFRRDQNFHDFFSLEAENSDLYLKFKDGREEELSFFSSNQDSITYIMNDVKSSSAYDDVDYLCTYQNSKAGLKYFG